MKITKLTKNKSDLHYQIMQDFIREGMGKQEASEKAAAIIAHKKKPNRKKIKR